MAAGQKKQEKADKKPRGPVRYIAFAEIRHDVWALVANGREASSVYTLRRELREEIAAAQADAGAPMPGIPLVIIPLDQAHIVEAEQQITVKETFTKKQLREPAPLGSLLAPQQLDPEAEVAARMGSEPAPPEAIAPGPDRAATPAEAARDRALAEAGEIEPGAEAAQAALVAEAAARTAAVLPPDPDDEDVRNPDTDPATGLSRRSAAEARPEDEGRTVFPIDNDL